LPGGRSILCRESAGRLVVMKPLPRDCLQKGNLHAHVRDRLGRIRELADLGVASLHGVEEDAALGPYLIWQWLEGENLSVAAAAQASPMAGEFSLGVARDLVTAVEKLHVLGLVHGALHFRNVIVSTEGGEQRLTLTHVSPLVIDDPGRDVSDLLRILRELNARPGAKPNPVLARILVDSDASTELADLRERLILAKTPEYVPATEARPEASASRSVWLAVMLLALAAAGSALLAWYLTWGGAA
jgi:hypothetical protein